MNEGALLHIIQTDGNFSNSMLVLSDGRAQLTHLPIGSFTFQLEMFDGNTLDFTTPRSDPIRDQTLDIEGPRPRRLHQHPTPSVPPACAHPALGDAGCQSIHQPVRSAITSPPLSENTQLAPALPTGTMAPLADTSPAT